MYIIGIETVIDITHTILNKLYFVFNIYVMKIIRARLKPYGGSSEFISTKGRIKSLIEKNKGDEFHFVVEDESVKTVKEFPIYKETGTIKNECRQCKRDREKRNKDKKRFLDVDLY